jgi:3-oxoacyl-ACP reductase-like protein
MPHSIRHPYVKQPDTADARHIPSSCQLRSQPTLRGRVALVTGASGSGVGSTTARLLAQRGADVIVNYLNNQAGATQVVEQIVTAGGRAPQSRRTSASDRMWSA